jgi:competence protein ComEA
LRIGVGAGIVLVLVALACAVLFSAIAPKGTTRTVSSPVAGSSSVAGTGAAGGSGAIQVPPTGSDTIFVHILGAVRSPGLYELKRGSRAVDVVAAAGGFTKSADQASVNLARFLTDGEQIVVPVIGEAPTTAATPGGASGPVLGSVGAAKVNLNTADETTLETLPRVGPAMAARILAWRTHNGRFTSIDDLKSVTGIGDKTFADLKDLVTV